MATTRYLGLGTILAVEREDSEASDGNGNRITLVVSGTPPARERELIDQTVLADELATNLLGIEMHSELSFTQYWVPGDEDHEYIDEIFDGKDIVEWEIRYTNGVVDTFDGAVSRIAPETIERGNTYTREVVVQRMSAITRT